MATNIDSAFQASPAGGDNPAQGDDKIREFKVAMYERWLKEHNMDLAEGGAQPRQGLHKAGSAVAFYQDTAPTQRNGVALATADAGLIWVKSNTGVWYQWSGSAWVSMSIDTINQIKSTLATGTAPLVVASTTKVDNLNADSVDGYGVTTVGNGLRAVHSYIADTDVSENTLYDEIYQAIPTINDWIPVSGSMGYGTGAGYAIFVVARARRLDADTVAFYGLVFFPNASTPTVSVGSRSVTNGNAGTTAFVNLAW